MKINFFCQYDFFEKTPEIVHLVEGVEEVGNYKETIHDIFQSWSEYGPNTKLFVYGIVLFGFNYLNTEY